jgi:hypothetical protein
MHNVCLQCGLYSEDKVIKPQDDLRRIALAICPYCGYGHPFRRQPLFALTGASGAGKTAICLELVRAQLEGALRVPSGQGVPDCVFLEQDILWRDEFADPENNYRAFRNLWLRVAKNVGQAGRPAVLCGTALPKQYEACPERRYFTAIHYLALICDDDLLRERLETRPGWRRSGSATFLAQMVEFNRWLLENAQHTQPPMTLLDTTALSVRQSAEQAAGWIWGCLGKG